MFLNSLNSADLGGVLPEDKGLSQSDSSAFHILCQSECLYTWKKNSGDCIILPKVTIFS